MFTARCVSCHLEGSQSTESGDANIRRGRCLCCRCCRRRPTSDYPGRNPRATTHTLKSQKRNDEGCLRFLRVLNPTDVPCCVPVASQQLNADAADSAASASGGSAGYDGGGGDGGSFRGMVVVFALSDSLCGALHAHR